METGAINKSLFALGKVGACIPPEREGGRDKWVEGIRDMSSGRVEGETEMWLG